MGAGAVFDVASAPTWLRLMWRLPLVDRFAYPRLVAGGHGYLAVDDPAVFDTKDALARGGEILPEGDEAPGSVHPWLGVTLVAVALGTRRPPDPPVTAGGQPSRSPFTAR